MGNQVQYQHLALNTCITHTGTTIPTPMGLQGVNPRGVILYESVSETGTKQSDSGM